MTLLRKTLKPKTIEFKADAPGVVVARFATLNVIDSDEDVTLPGAFGEQAVRMQPYGHDTYSPSIGKGTIAEEAEDAIAMLKVNLQMAAGKETYESLKFDSENGEALTEWSYTYDVVKSSNGQHDGRDVRFLEDIKVHSVDPVFLGAGVQTATLDVKAKDLPFLEHVASIEADVKAFVERCSERAAVLENEGRKLSGANRERLAGQVEALRTAADDIAKMLADGDPPEVKPTPAINLRRMSADLEMAAHQLAS